MGSPGRGNCIRRPGAGGTEGGTNIVGGRVVIDQYFRPKVFDTLIPAPSMGGGGRVAKYTLGLKY